MENETKIITLWGNILSKNCSLSKLNISEKTYKKKQTGIYTYILLTIRSFISNKVVEKQTVPKKQGFKKSKCLANVFCSERIRIKTIKKITI